MVLTGSPLRFAASPMFTDVPLFSWPIALGNR
jgi:hypothetical protein